TPLITASGASADTNYRRDKGWVRQVLWTKDRSVKNWVDWVIATGQVNSKTRNGIIYTDVPEDRQVVNEVFIPYMKKRGLQVTEVAALSYPGSTSPDASASEAETQASVLKFKASGVELVWPLSNPLQVYLWVKSADAAQYKPRYTVCDATGMTTSITSIYPPSQWEGVKGITVLRTGEVPAGSRPTHQTYKECEAVYKAHGETIAPNPDDASKLDDTEIASMENYCELVSLFAEVAKRAGINPTRRSLLAGFNDLGTWTSRVAMTEQLSFSKTKYDGADYFEVVRWDSGCTCYRQVEGFRKGTW
ncbi:MAG: ABC transporter substrate-binding protein, partial [Actinomycetota bacterium]